jgi:hypothetical protein
MSLFDAPAYVRRARRVENSLAELLGQCNRQRDEWLEMARILLGRVAALAGTWEALRPHLADDDQLDLLRDLHDQLRPTLRVPVEPTTSRYALRGALRELVEALERINHRWAEYLAEVDLDPINAVREGYNRYYLLEKECALRLAPGARRDFRPLEPFTRGELIALLPPLPVPRLA